MKKLNSKIYNSSQQALYSISRIAWKSYMGQIAAFTSFDEAYTTAYGNAALAAVEAAALLPDGETKRGLTKSKRKKLVAAARKCRSLWQKLYSYIKKAFPEEQWDAMRILAGGSYYKQASGDNWKLTQSLLTMAAQFIADNTSSLQQPGKGMPTGFPVLFNEAKTDFETICAEYNNLKKEGLQLIAAKVEANNAVYTTLITMLNDGKIIFEDDAVLRKFFTYNAITTLAGKSNKTGLRIAVVDSMSKLPSTTTTFLFQPGNISAFTNSKGIAEVKLQAGVVYNYTATTPGHPTQYSENIKPVAGTMHRIKLVLIKESAVA